MSKLEIVETIKLLAGKKSCKEIADQCGTTHYDITNLAYQNKISLRVEPQQQAVIKFLQGNQERLTAREVANRFNVNVSSVYGWAARAGYELKPIAEGKKTKTGSRFFRVSARTNWLI